MKDPSTGEQGADNKHGDWQRARRLPGVLLDGGDCPYLADRRFTLFYLTEAVDGAEYRKLLEQRFRRMGRHVYRPACSACDECRPLRIDIRDFHPRRDQRRCRQRNSDLRVNWAERHWDDERFDLYVRYQSAVHGDDPAELRRDCSLAEDGGIDGGELHARDDDGRLLAVSVIDRFDDALSGVYCYYDPEMPRRSLGTFMMLAEIDCCRQLGLRWLYPGFLVRGCGKMAYKARFRPHEVLEDGRWVRYE